MTIKTMFAAAAGMIALGLAVPATAAEPPVQLAMASFAASNAGADAAVRSEAKQEHYRTHHDRHAAAHQEGETCNGCADCGECATCSSCTKCDSCETASCEGGTCHAGGSQDAADA